MNYFRLFHLDETFDISITDLRREYHEALRLTHPDRFVAKSVPEQAEALMKSTQLNLAFKVLTDPLKRAYYLLQQRGNLGTSDDLTHYVPADFLAKQFGLREQLEQHKERRNRAELKGFLDQLAEEKGIHFVTLQTALQSEPFNVTDAKTALASLYFLVPLYQEATTLEEAIVNDITPTR